MVVSSAAMPQVAGSKNNQNKASTPSGQYVLQIKLLFLVPIGEFFITVRQLLEGPGPSNEHPCINPKKKAKKSSYKNSGVIHLVQMEMYKAYSFLDYIRGGTEIAATISIGE